MGKSLSHEKVKDRLRLGKNLKGFRRPMTAPNVAFGRWRGQNNSPVDERGPDDSPVDCHPARTARINASGAQRWVYPERGRYPGSLRPQAATALLGPRANARGRLCLGHWLSFI